MNVSRLLSIVVFVLCFACSKPLPVLDGIDREEWAVDRNACGDTRASMREAIEREKEKLLGLDQIEVVKLLGKPDQHELSSRNEKFFYYFLDPAPTCEKGNSSPKKLIVRFNAVGLAKEVLVE